MRTSPLHPEESMMDPKVPAACRTAGRAAVAALWPLLLVAPTTATAQADTPLSVSASVYGWFPDIRGQTRFTPAAGGGDFGVDIGDLLENLEFTFQGNVDVRQGRWGGIFDLIYMSVGNTVDAARDGTIGGVRIPAGASATTEFDNKTRIWTLAGYYRALEQPGLTLDVVGGVRYLDVKQTVDWTFTGNVGQIPVSERTGSGSASVGNLDAIVGLRGRVAFAPGGAWFVPWYVDVGTGESHLTWQAMAGVGYAFKWGEAVAAWRYMEYRLPSDAAVTNLKLDGPVVGATFRW